MHRRLLALALVVAPAAAPAAPRVWTVDSTLSSVNVELSATVLGVVLSDSDFSPVAGTLAGALTPVAHPLDSIHLTGVDLLLTRTLSFQLIDRFLGGVNATGTGLALFIPGPGGTGVAGGAASIDPANGFAQTGNLFEAAGIIDYQGVGLLGAGVGAGSINLADQGTFPGDIAGTLVQTPGLLTLTAPLDIVQTSAPNGILLTTTITGTLVATTPNAASGWRSDASGLFGDASNWVGGAPAGDYLARLGPVVTTARTVTLDVDVTLDALTVDSGGGSYVLDSSGTARLTVNRIAVDAGRLDLDDSSGNRAAVKANAASIAPGATLNLKGGALVVDYAAEASPLGDLAALALAGALTADAGGVGIVEASALGATSFGGVSVDADAVLVAGTFRGDTNLDGQVDVSDLGNLASGWQQPGGWLNGDFNYDGTVDVSDLGDLATNWQAGVTGPLAPEASLPRALIAAGLGSAGLGGVIPEPASLSLLALGALAIRRRR